MKLISYVHDFGGEPMISLGWGTEGLFFSGTQPAVPSLITLTMPGASSEKDAAIRSWLIAHHARTDPKQLREKERVDIDATLWRPTVLDDFLDAKNATSMVWYVAKFFTATQIADFAAAHAPGFHRDVRQALVVERHKRAKALTKMAERSSRIVPIFSSGQSRLSTEAHDVRLEIDRETMAKVTATPFDATRWIDAITDLHTDDVIREMLAEIARRLVATGGDIAAALDRMVARDLAKIYAVDMWQVLADHVQFPATVTGETIDISKAREVTAPLGWQLWTARRVGPIKVGRPALCIANGNKVTYIRGERRLKHAVRARGGTMNRWGNTLVLVGRGPASVHGALLEVDKIDTLAYIDPARAVALVGAPLPDADPIANAFRNAERDPRWRRILADLLIERLVGIDADVARHLARAEAAGNRRRR